MLAVAAAGYRAVALAWVRALGPATGAGGGVVRRPGGGSPRHPGCSFYSQGSAADFWVSLFGLHCLVLVGEKFSW